MSSGTKYRVVYTPLYQKYRLEREVEEYNITGQLHKVWRVVMDGVKSVEEGELLARHNEEQVRLLVPQIVKEFTV